MSAPRSQSPLRALVNIISAGVDAIEAAYAAQNTPFPSLDDPFTPDALMRDPHVAKHTAQVAGAAAQLGARMQAPQMQLFELVSGMNGAAAIGVANEFNVVEILREAGPQGLHAEEIAKRAGTDGDKIGRILRYLAARHVFREVSPCVFANNRVSSVLDTGKSVDAILANPEDKYTGTSGASAMTSLMTETHFRGTAALPAFLRSPAKASSAESKDCPLMDVYTACTKDCWAWYEEPGNEHILKTFQLAMGGSGRLSSAGLVLVEAFDWAGVPKGGVVVDIGGGVGRITLALARAHPHLRYVVQDRAAVIPDAKAFWEQEEPEALTSGRVSLQAHDFFSPQPVTDARVFLLSAVTHDWSDKYCRVILSHLRAAAADARLIIVESIVPYACGGVEGDGEGVEGAGAERAEWPLLPGSGALFAYASDMFMMASLNGKERTLGDFVALGHATGWALERIVRGVGVQACLIYRAA